MDIKNRFDIGWLLLFVAITGVGCQQADTTGDKKTEQGGSDMHKAQIRQMQAARDSYATALSDALSNNNLKDSDLREYGGGDWTSVNKIIKDAQEEVASDTTDYAKAAGHYHKAERLIASAISTAKGAKDAEKEAARKALQVGAERQAALDAGKGFTTSLAAAKRSHGVSSRDLLDYGGPEYAAVLMVQKKAYNDFCISRYTESQRGYEKAAGLIYTVAKTAAHRKTASKPIRINEFITLP